MLSQHEIVEIQRFRSASDRPKVPSSISPSPSTTLPRARSSTTILLRSSSRSLPNGGYYATEIKEIEEKGRQTEVGEKAGTENHEVCVMPEDTVSGGGGIDRKLSANHIPAAASRIQEVSANEDGSERRQSSSGDVGVWRSSVVEMMATLVLTFTSIAAIIACLRADFDYPRIAVAITQFLIYTMCIVAAAPLSGAHLNPSFSFVCILVGHISPLQGMLYIVAQSAGSVLGALFVRACVPSDIAQRYYLGGCLLKQQVLDANLDTVSLVGADFGPALVAELFFSFLLIAVALPLLILCPSSTTRYYSTPAECPAHLPQFLKLNFASFMDPALLRAAFIIGLLLGLLIFISGQLLSPGYTSAGMNPARCFGPAVAEGGADLWRPQWVFWLGPFLAAFLFSLLYGIIFLRHPHRTSHEDRLDMAHQDHNNAETRLPVVDASENPAVRFKANETSSQQPQGKQHHHHHPSSVADSPSRRMDVFLHIKATIQKPEQLIPDEREKGTDAFWKTDPVSGEATNDQGHIILDHANLSLRDLMEIPSSSSSNIALKLEKLLRDSQES